MSASPAAMIASACSGSVMRPTAIVTMPVARRISRAKGTWMPGAGAGIFCAGETPPLDTSIQSQPRAFSRRASSIASSSVQPPSTQSVAETRTPSGRSAGQAARTASNTSSGKRMRLSNLPP